MLEDKWACLLSVTFPAILIQSRHRQPACRFKDVRTMRIMALYTILPVFQHGMMLREIEFSMCLQMAIETGRRVLSRVDDEFATPAACFDMFAAWAVA